MFLDRFKKSIGIFVVMAFSMTPLIAGAEKMRPSKDQDPFLKLRLSPLSSLARIVEGDLSIRLQDTALTIGVLGEINKMKLVDTETDALALGALATYYWQGSAFKDSFYSTAKGRYRWGYSEKVDQFDNLQASADFKVGSLILMMGYQWHWTHVNLNVAAGGGLHSVELTNAFGPVNKLFMSGSFESISGLTSNHQTIGSFAAELTLGWSF